VRGRPRYPAAGASGHVTIGANAAGTTIQYGQELEDQNTRAKYMCVRTDLYYDGESVPVLGVDTGPSTNKDAGAVLQWVGPPAGCETNCTVTTQSDGSGLSGGRNEETDVEALQWIKDWNSNQPAAGNKAKYVLALQDVPGLRVEQGFAYPATLGPGAIGLTFTMPPVKPGASRIPNSTQLNTALAYIQGQFPEDDGQFLMPLAEESRDVCLIAEWNSGAVGWANFAPWPAYYEVAPGAGSGALRVSLTYSATNFIIAAANGDYSTCGSPAVGTVLGVFDQDAGVFRRKEIATVTGTGPWTVTCETNNNASDTTYSPETDQRICPWSDSLNAVAAKVLAYFDSLGPGEQQSVFTDAGARQKRYPEAPVNWHHDVTSGRMQRVILDFADLADLDVEEGEGDTSVGTPGGFVRLLRLHDITIFAS
jgi:hypothetical protein